MPSVAPSTLRTAAPSLLLAACLTCLPLVGCGNRGELYLPADVELEPEGLSTERPEPAVLPQDPLAGAEAERRVITPSDTVNAITPSVPSDEEEEQGVGGERTGEGAKEASGDVREDGR